MDRQGTLPTGVVRPRDLAELVQAHESMLTVYLAVERSIDHASQRAVQKWRTLRRDVASAGAPEHLLAEVDALVEVAHLEGSGLAVLGTTDGVRHVEHHDTQPPDHASWAATPRLIPLLEWRQSALSYVLVRTDRTGADVVAVHDGRPAQHADAGGATDPVRKSAPGGWSQRRFQQRAENTWKHNADDVAEVVRSLVDAVDARLVLVAGDVRAIQLLRAALPRSIGDVLVEIAGGRAEDGSHAGLEQELRRALDEVVARDTAAILAAFAEERGQHDRAVEGVEATLEALRRARVEVLIVSDGRDDAARAWFGSGPGEVAASSEELVALGVDGPRQAGAIDVMVRAALASGAGVRVVPDTMAPTNGVGALLRWST